MTPDDDACATIQRMPVPDHVKRWLARSALVERRWWAIAIVRAHAWRQRQRHSGPAWWRRWWGGQ